jgi:uncharacterized protein
VPRRRCAGCGRVAPKSELVRFAIARNRDGSGGLVVQDREGRMGGRGAYICSAASGVEPDAGCLQGALRRGGFQRTLRATVALDPEIVESVGR